MTGDKKNPRKEGKGELHTRRIVSDKNWWVVPLVSHMLYLFLFPRPFSPSCCGSRWRLLTQPTNQ